MNEHTIASRLTHLDALYAVGRGKDPFMPTTVFAMVDLDGTLIVRANMAGRDALDSITGRGRSFEAALDALEYKLLELDA